MNTPEQKAELQRLNRLLVREGSYYRIRTSGACMVNEFGPFYVLDTWSNIVADASKLPDDVQRGFDHLFDVEARSPDATRQHWRQ